MHPVAEQALDARELARLDAFLRSRHCGPNAMGLSYAHGFATALRCGPEALAADEWLRLVFDEPVFASGVQAQEMLGLALRLERDIERGLARGELRPVLEYERLEGAVRLEASPWCQGFDDGVRLFRELWLEEAFARLAHPLALIVRLAYGPKAEDGEYARLCAALPEAARAIYAYWHGV